MNNKGKAVAGLLTLTMSSTFCCAEAQAIETDVVSNLNVVNTQVKKEEVVNKAITLCNLNLRIEPVKKDGNIILTMKKDSVVEVLSTNNGWSKVKYAGIEGYAYTEYLQSMLVKQAFSFSTSKFKVNAASISVREGASNKNNVIGVLRKGQVVEGKIFNNSWTKIIYNGKESYVASKYLDEIHESEEALNIKMRVNSSSSVTIRTGAGRNYGIIGKLSKGDEINVLSTKDGWARYNHKGLNAYVELKYLEEVKDVPSTQTPQYTYEIVNKDMVVSVDKASLRTGPGKEYTVVGVFKKGEIVKVERNVSNGWSEILYGGNKSYVLTSDLSEKNANADTNINVDTNTNVSNRLEQYKYEVLRLVNAERAKQGLCELKMSENLSRVAQLKSQDMVDNNYFNHTSPTYGSPFDMMKSNGIVYKVAGENIAKGHTSPEQVVLGWMNSEGHRKNIMNPRFTELGMGVAKSSSGTIHWTQMFVGYN